MPGTFQEVLTQAVDDLVEHGFDSQERVDRWMRELRIAAEGSLVTAETLESMLRQAYATIYKRMVDRGGLVRYTPGVSRFTLEQVKPKLRAELDRRILASANLIRLNRKQAIEKTLQRFQGWSTSIPAGGTEQAVRRETKQAVRKSLSSLPFEERRVLIDQGHKLVASLSKIVAVDSGAIAGRWRSHWRQAGYDYREDHKERDDEVYAVRGSWALDQGLMKVGKAGYTDAITAPGEEVYCRCYYVWIFSLRDLPADMLTEKGKRVLKDAKAQAAARADAMDPPSFLEEVEELDRLGYMRGMKGIRVVPDKNEWHAQYDPDTDQVEVQVKFGDQPFDGKVHILLHEAGHRGQDVDPSTYEDFKRRHMNTMPNFLDMANQVHLHDLHKRGKVDSIAAEVFAESYARAMMGLDMPDELAKFWGERIAA